MDAAIRYYSEQFCTLANVNDVIKNLSEELYVTGLPTLPEYNTQQPVADQQYMICCLANALWALIQLNRRNLELKRNAEKELISLNSDNNSLKIEVKNMRGELHAIKDKVRLEKVKNKQMELDRDVSQAEVKTLKGVVVMLKKDLLLKSQLYCREIKKYCDESVKLRHRLNSSFAKGTIKNTVKGASKNQNKNDEECEPRSLVGHVKADDKSCQITHGKTLHKNCAAENLTLSKEELYKRSIRRLQNTITALVGEANIARQRYLDLSCDVITLIDTHTGVDDRDGDHFHITKSMHIMPSDYDVIHQYTSRILNQLKLMTANAELVLEQ